MLEEFHSDALRQIDVAVSGGWKAGATRDWRGEARAGHTASDPRKVRLVLPRPREERFQFVVAERIRCLQLQGGLVVRP